MMAGWQPMYLTPNTCAITTTTTAPTGLKQPTVIYSYCVMEAFVTCHYCLCFCLSFHDGLNDRNRINISWPHWKEHTFWANICLTHATHAAQPARRAELVAGLRCSSFFLGWQDLIKHPARRVIWIIPSAEIKLQPGTLNPLTEKPADLKFSGVYSKV